MGFHRDRLSRPTSNLADSRLSHPSSTPNRTSSSGFCRPRRGSRSGSTRTPIPS